MCRWRCVAEDTGSDLGTGGAGNRAARIPVTVTRTPRLPRSANDNQPPRWLRVLRVAILLAMAGGALLWLKL